LFNQILSLLKSLQRIFFFSLLLILHVEAFSQGIKAGETGPGFYYLDIDPDTVLTGINHQNTESYTFDINNDGVSDFIISASATGGMGGGGGSVTIEPLNGAQAAEAVTDSCFGGPGHSLIATRTPAQIFNFGDSVSNQSVWSDSYTTIRSYSWGAFWEDTAYFAYTCYYGLFDTMPAYAGVRVFTQPDTIYGWIRLKNTSSSQTTIDAFASSQNAHASTSNYPAKGMVALFPSPVMRSLNITLYTPLNGNAEVYVFDIMGHIHWQGVITTQSVVIDTEMLPAGIYLVKFKQQNNTETLRFMKL